MVTSKKKQLSALGKITGLLRHRFSPALLTAVFILTMFAASYALQLQSADAAYFQRAFLRIDRMKASTTTGGRVCANPATAGTETHVQVTFPTGFTVNTTASNWTTDTTNLDTGQTAWPGRSSGNATSATGQTVVWTSSDMSVGTLYCFNFTGTSTLTTSTAGADKTGSISTCTSATCSPTQNTIDSSNYATAVIAEDQITVTATVPPNFNFVIASCSAGNCTDTFTADLSPSAIRSTNGKTVTLTTNAANGWIAWVKDSNQGLTSATRSYTIATTTAGSSCASGHTLSAGTEGYGLDVDLTTNGAGGGTPTIDANYDCGASAAGGLSANFLPIASSNGGADGDVITLIERAAISNLTKDATDYTDVLTVVGAGQF